MNWNGFELPDKDVYFRDEDVLIYCDDCRNVLPQIPDKSIDLVLTDPPYGVEVASINKGGDGGRKAKNRNRLGCYDDSPDNLEILIAEFVPLVQVLSTCVVVCSGIKTLMYYPQPDWIVAWIYENKNLFSPYGFNNWTPLLCYGKDPFQQRRRGNAPLAVKTDVIFDNTPPEHNGHPTPKPVSFIRKAIERFSIDEGDLILDPFLGSGTTAYCAKKLGRKCIGIEIEERYCEIASKRCSQSVMRL